ncbi:MAG: hypothetical protein LC798_12800 [Chloroflexi bacterium]|nr:hypothetical protein [Chloroflexota bacterium]
MARQNRASALAQAGAGGQTKAAGSSEHGVLAELYALLASALNPDASTYSLPIEGAAGGAGVPVGARESSRLKTHNALSVAAAGGLSNVDLTGLGGYRILHLLVRMTGAAVGDLGAEVRPYEDDGTTLFNQPLDEETDGAVAAVLLSGVVRRQMRFDLAGLDRAQVRIINNHATVAQTATVVASLQR